MRITSVAVARAVLLVFLCVGGLLLAGCDLSGRAAPVGLSPMDAEVWDALRSSDSVATIAGVRLREFPGRFWARAPRRANPKGNRTVFGATDDDVRAYALMRGYWRADIKAKPYTGMPARKNFTGLAILSTYSVRGKQIYPDDPHTGEPMKIYWDYEYPHSGLKPVFLDADSTEPIEVYCIARDGKRTREVVKDWCAIVALVGKRGIVCTNTPGWAGRREPYRRCFRRFKLVAGSSRDCVEESITWLGSMAPPGEPMEGPKKALIPPVVMAQVTEIMKGKGASLKLGNQVIEEASAETRLIPVPRGLARILRRVRRSGGSAVKLPRVGKIVQFWKPRDFLPSSLFLSVTAYLRPEVNTDSGTGVWVSATRIHFAGTTDEGPYYYKTTSDQYASWLDMRDPDHVGAVFIPHEGKVSRTYDDKWYVAVFTRWPDILVVWKAPPKGKVNTYKCPDTGYRRFRFKKWKGKKPQDAYGPHLLEELFPGKK